jgi:uncharacterized RDD family membrane protein YckC
VRLDEHTEYAGFWRRAAAFLVDQLWLGLISAALLFAVYGTEYFYDLGEGERPLVYGWEEPLIDYAFPLLATVLFWRLMMATPGKLLLGCLVVDARSGRTVGTGQALLRYLGYIVSALPLGLGFVWIAFDRRKQGFHDKIARTCVVIEDEAAKELDEILRGVP